MPVVISICYTFTCSFPRHCVFRSLHPMFADSKIYIWDAKCRIPSAGCCCSVALRFSGLGLWSRTPEGRLESSGPSLAHLVLWQYRCFLSLPLSASVGHLWPLYIYIKKDWSVSSGYFLPDTQKNNLFKWKLNKLMKKGNYKWNWKKKFSSVLFYKSSDHCALWEM